MQLYALNEDNLIVSIESADRRQKYRCPECLSPLLLRQGSINRPHFAHVKKANSCRRAQMSANHLALQQFLASLFPKEAQMEKRFEAIQRVADVALPEKKVIFEVQCSLISIEEIKERTADYLSLGYRPIWLLHLDRFRGAKVEGLSHINCYFTDFNALGKGQFYDRLPLTSKSAGHLFAIDIASFAEVPPWKGKAPPLLQERLKRPLFVQGDLLSLYLEGKHPEWFKEAPAFSLGACWQSCKELYGLFLESLLELTFKK
ncbi:MAG: putative transcription factor, CoiA-like family [Chlamydiales bacterium]|jgi:competence protein CoiA|nr:putative transcription factor, CoiA-like family [Chlamydiales bacterium]